VTSTIGKKLVSLQGFPYMPSNFGDLWFRNAENGWRVFANPLNVRIGRHYTNQTEWTFYNRQQANFGTCYVMARAYSLEQQNAGRAHAGLCHASSGRVDTAPTFVFSTTPLMVDRYLTHAVYSIHVR